MTKHVNATRPGVKALAGAAACGRRTCPAQPPCATIVCSAYVKWASGAAGSAREWHSRGHRFDPGLVHQPPLIECSGAARRADPQLS